MGDVREILTYEEKFARCIETILDSGLNISSLLELRKKTRNKHPCFL
jgi:hypothetical protein